MSAPLDQLIPIYHRNDVGSQKVAQLMRDDQAATALHHPVHNCSRSTQNLKTPGLAQLALRAGNVHRSLARTT